MQQVTVWTEQGDLHGEILINNLRSRDYDPIIRYLDELSDRERSKFYQQVGDTPQMYNGAHLIGGFDKSVEWLLGH